MLESPEKINEDEISTNDGYNRMYSIGTKAVFTLNVPIKHSS
jgi:hypothetical protein